MSRITVTAGALAIVMMALALSVAASDADEAHNVNVSLNSNALRTGDALTVSYEMPADYAGGELYIRERNASSPLYFSVCPGAAGAHTVAWTCNAAEGFYYVIVFGVDNDSYQEGNACGFTVDNSPPVTVASAPGGSGWRKNTVTLTAQDAISGVRTIFYSLDGANWQQCNDTGAGRITVPGGEQTIKFYAVDRAGNKESVRSVTYSIDDQPPETAAALTGTAGLDGWYTGDVQVALDASDSAAGAAGTYYLLNGVEYAYNGTFTLGTGTYWLTYWSKDAAGNVESPHDRTICVDAYAPATTASPPGGPDRYATSVVTLTATGVSGVKGLYYSYNGEDWTPCSSSDPAVGYVVMAEGNHTLYYRAQGNNGLWETPRSAAYIVDTHKPLITATLEGSRGDNGWYNGNVQVTLSASDGGSGVASVSYDLDGRPGNYTGPFTVGDGFHSLTVRCTDRAGNVNATTVSGVNVDATRPEITCALSGMLTGEGWYASDVLAILQPSDSTAGVGRIEYRIGDGDWNGYAGPFTVKMGEQVTIYYRCADKAGNAASGSQVISFQPRGYIPPDDDSANEGNGGNGDNSNASVGNSTIVTPAPAAVPTVTPAPSETATPAPGATTTPSTRPSATPAPAQAQELTGLSWLLLPIVIIAAVGALVAFAYYVRKKNGGS